MTISALGSSQDLSALTQTSASARRPQPPSADKFTGTAQLLGLSTDDLKSQLDSGKTLDSIASDKGVSSDDLLTAVKSDLKASRPDGAPDISDDQLTQVATNIAAGKGPRGAGGHHHHGGGPPPGTSASDTTQTLQTLADALGTTPDDLTSQLQSGTDLSSLFGESGSATWSQQSTAGSGLAVDLYA
ncbi:MAG TPA: hypothetical protein VI318_07160 [Baekduia sp.]